VLKDWLANRRSGPPNDTPWPNWPPQRPGCEDKDHDSIPNLAERWDLGLNMDLESTDRDKFDDGQELFGVTYCPGGDLSCSYGDLPRSSDSGYVGAVMPSWVKASGNHPLVAAFPVPEVDVVESSLHVETVTTVTTDHTIASGTERSYSTAKTEGTSTSVANTVTWNEWQEVSETRPSLAGAGALSFEPRRTESASGSGMDLLSMALDAVGMFVPAVGQAKFGWDYIIKPIVIPSPVGEEHEGIDAGVKIAGYVTGPSASTSEPGLNNGPTCQIQPPDCPIGGTQKPSSQGSITVNGANTSSQDRVSDLAGTYYAYSPQSMAWSAFQAYPMAYPSPVFIPSTTVTHGSSHGGAQTTTAEQYEEHTVTNGEAFSSEESWSIATAVDSAHAADLWFTYKVRNSGTEYAREIANLAFNVYIGDDPNPATTYFVGPDLGGDGKFHNFMPNEEHTYTSQRVSLTLEQMKVVDLGGPIRCSQRQYAYGYRRRHR
jgi:hypothetical protein